MHRTENAYIFLDDGESIPNELLKHVSVIEVLFIV